LHHAFAGLGDLALLAQPVGAVGADLARLASDLDGHELGHLVVALATGRHAAIVLATAGGCTYIQRGIERGDDELDVTQLGSGDGGEGVEQLDDAAIAIVVAEVE
jgi:hypothetical protein